MKQALVYIFICLTVGSYSQVHLKGQIRSDSSRGSLSKAIVSIQELNIVTQSNESGFYELKKLPKGRFTIMYKLLGYESKVVTLQLNDTLTEQNITLKQSFLQYPEVVIYGTNNSSSEKTANTISRIDASDMRTGGAMNLSDGIAKIPGVSQLTTGSGISKPVIRGLYGNRIQTVLYGL
ncbi:MAG: carboxypeptidase-like regulatory domain-containing protein, partial [Bacteroidia bacterium]